MLRWPLQRDAVVGRQTHAGTRAGTHHAAMAVCAEQRTCTGQQLSAEVRNGEECGHPARTAPATASLVSVQLRDASWSVLYNTSNK